jgi:predicted O-methyltransferase YrrM
LWSAYDAQAAEVEVLEFVHALVRLLKPTLALETGCHRGASSLSIASALARNGRGRLHTCDIQPDLVAALAARAQREGLPIEVTCQSGLDLIESLHEIDFALIDSGSYRKEEAEALVTRLSPLGMFALHDTAPHHAAGYERLIPDGLEYIYMNSPRGLTLFQRRTRLAIR